MYGTAETLEELRVLVVGRYRWPVYIGPWGLGEEPVDAAVARSENELKKAFDSAMALSQNEARVHVSCRDFGRTPKK